MNTFLEQLSHQTRRHLLGRTGDPLGQALAHRDRPEVLRKAKAELEARFDRGPKPGKKDKKEKKDRKNKRGG